MFLKGRGTVRKRNFLWKPTWWYKFDATCKLYKIWFVCYTLSSTYEKGAPSDTYVLNIFDDIVHLSEFQNTLSPTLVWWGEMRVRTMRRTVVVRLSTLLVTIKRPHWTHSHTSLVLIIFTVKYFLQIILVVPYNLKSLSLPLIKNFSFYGNFIELTFITPL